MNSQRSLKVVKSLVIIIVCIHLQTAWSSNKEIFTEEYIRPFNHNYSNPTSLSFSSELIDALKTFHVFTLIDAGCGEASWQKSLMPFCSYIGVDIVDAIIDKNKKTNSDENCTFLSKDITQEDIPRGDLILCRDCLNYFSYFDISQALKHFKSSQSTFLCATTFPDTKENEETSTGIKRKINLQAEPFFFPAPLWIIKEGSSENGCLGLWRLSDIDLAAFDKFLFPSVSILSKPIGGRLQWEHVALISSLRRGLPKVHRSFNINPKALSEVNKNVVVVSDIRAGKQAYQLKEDKKIETLLVGPTIVPSVSAYDSFITWPLINGFLTNCEWVTSNFLKFNELLRGRLFNWFAGIDETYWKPLFNFREKSSNNVLLYRKTNFELCDQVQRCLQEYGYKVIPITYGNYNLEQYKSALDQCNFAVFISRSESQGIALAEAWGADVPTLVWDSGGEVHYEGYTYENVSSCPYLTSWTGKTWSNIEEFRYLLDNFNKILIDFQPRRWVLLHMTDKISSELLISHIRGIVKSNKQ